MRELWPTRMTVSKMGAIDRPSCWWIEYEVEPSSTRPGVMMAFLPGRALRSFSTWLNPV